MTLEKIIEKLAAKSSILISPITVKENLAYKVEPNFLLPFLKALKESEELRFTVLTDLFGSDFSYKMSFPQKRGSRKDNLNK